MQIIQFLMIIDEYGDSDLREFIKPQQVIYGRKGSSGLRAPTPRKNTSSEDLSEDRLSESKQQLSLIP